MAKVYVFPAKKQLPSAVKELLDQSAKVYVEALYATSQLYGIKELGQADYEEIVELVALEYAEALSKAIDEM